MRAPFQDGPVDTYSIPPLAPPEVKSADDNFQRLSFEYAEVKSQLAEAFELRQHEISQAHAAATAKRVEGGKPPAKTPDKVEAEWDAKLSALRSELAVVADALDQAGDTLVETIADNKKEWIEAFIKQDVERTAALADAVSVVEACLVDLQHARSAPEWLRGRRAQGYPGGRINASLGNLRDIINPPRALRHYRERKAIYERPVPGGELRLEYADGTPVEPEVVREIRSSRRGPVRGRQA